MRITKVSLNFVQPQFSLRSFLGYCYDIKLCHVSATTMHSSIDKENDLRSSKPVLRNIFS